MPRCPPNSRGFPSLLSSELNLGASPYGRMDNLLDRRSGYSRSSRFGHGLHDVVLAHTAPVQDHSPLSVVKSKNLTVGICISRSLRRRSESSSSSIRSWRCPRLRARLPSLFCERFNDEESAPLNFDFCAFLSWIKQGSPYLIGSC